MKPAFCLASYAGVSKCLLRLGTGGEGEDCGQVHLLQDPAVGPTQPLVHNLQCVGWNPRPEAPAAPSQALSEPR